jgi:hypothetical protein
MNITKAKESYKKIMEGKSATKYDTPGRNDWITVDKNTQLNIWWHPIERVYHATVYNDIALGQSVNGVKNWERIA